MDGTNAPCTTDQAQRSAEADRRNERRRVLEIVRGAALSASLATSEYICGTLPVERRDAFANVRDPIAALANLNRAIVQIVLAEERLDETEAERAERRAAQRTDAERTLRRAENKHDVQHAVRAITLDHLRMPYNGREKVLADLFRELEKDGGYDGDPAEIVADACARLGLTPRIVPDAEIQTPDGKIDLAARKARLLAFARTYLDLMKPAAPADERDGTDPTDPSEPFAQAQGPPH